MAVLNVLIAAIAVASLALNLALKRFGIAIAAKRTKMATTIMISTSVKPYQERIFLSSFLGID